MDRCPCHKHWTDFSCDLLLQLINHPSFTVNSKEIRDTETRQQLDGRLKVQK